MAKQKEDNNTKPQGRDPLNIAIVGKRRLGKSKFIRQKADDIVASQTKRGNQKRVLVIDMARSVWFQDLAFFRSIEEFITDCRLPKGHADKWEHGVRCIRAKNEKKFMETLLRAIHENFVNGVVFYDEGNSWIEVSGSVPDYQKVIFTQNGNKGVENYLAVHRFADVHKQLRGHFDGYVVFKTEDTFNSPRDLQAAGFPSDQNELWNIIQKVKEAPMTTNIVQTHGFFLSQTVKDSINLNRKK